jgi:hypothetical protein
MTHGSLQRGREVMEGGRWEGEREGGDGREVMGGAGQA